MVAQFGNRSATTLILSTTCALSMTEAGWALTPFTRAARDGGKLAICPFSQRLQLLHPTMPTRNSLQKTLKGKINKWCPETSLSTCVYGKNSFWNLIPYMLFSVTLKFHWLSILLLRQCKNIVYSWFLDNFSKNLIMV